MSEAIKMKFPEYIIDVHAVVTDPVNRDKLESFIKSRYPDASSDCDAFIQDPSHIGELKRFAAYVVFEKTACDMVKTIDDDLLSFFFEDYEEPVQESLPEGIIDELDLL